MRPFTDSTQPVLRVGDFVEVRSKKEILASLDEKGALDNLPFMPEMIRFCGQRFEVLKRADKTCDTASQTGMRRLKNTVHLKELRCDGSAHAGCEAACLLFWKEQWLKKVGTPARGNSPVARVSPLTNGNRPARCTEELLSRSVLSSAHPSAETPEPVYSCQATCVPRFTTPLPWWDVRQYIRDLTSGNVTPGMLVYGLVLGARGKFRSLRGRPALRKLSGKRTRTPAEAPSLRPGDLVRIKCTGEIRGTLDPKGRNRGLSFTRDMVSFCGGEYRVLRRIHKIIDERTGKLISLAGGCLILDGVVCRGHLTRFCPRLTYQFWRDVWLSKSNSAECESQELHVLPPKAAPPSQPAPQPFGVPSAAQPLTVQEPATARTASSANRS